MDKGLLIALGFSILALIYGAWQAKWIIGQPDGNDRMREIAAAIQAGAKAYLNRQYTTIGMVGGGQLGRMFAIAARRMGYRIITLDPTDDCPTAHLSDAQTIAPYDDVAAAEGFARLCDVVTFEFENVPAETLSAIERVVQVHPSPVVELNRAVAVGMAFGPAAALELVDELKQDASLARYPWLPSVRGDLLVKLGRPAEARTEFEAAAGLTRNKREQALLLERARACAAPGPGR